MCLSDDPAIHAAPRDRRGSAQTKRLVPLARACDHSVSVVCENGLPRGEKGRQWQRESSVGAR